MKEGTHLIKRGFNAAGGANKEAYLSLDNIIVRFQECAARYEELQALKWLLPEGPGLDAIVEQMKEQRRKQVDLLHNPKRHVAALLKVAELQSALLNEWERGNLLQFRRLYTHFSGFKNIETITRYEETLGEAEQEWLETLNVAREKGAAAAFQKQIPILEKAFSVRREGAREPARRLGVKISEACLDLLNPGMKNDKIDRILEQQKAFYPGLIAAVSRREAEAEPALPLNAHISRDRQLQLFSTIKDAFLESAGWTKEELKRSGVLIHLATAQTGFSWGSPKNIRLTIETYEDDLLEGIGNTLHECGHLLYLLEMNRLPPEAQGRPVGTFNGFGVHETAAIYFEQVGLRRQFFDIIAPLIKKELDVSGPQWSAENLYNLANKPVDENMEWGSSELALGPNMAWRVLAERKILDEELAVKDLPEFWAKTMKDFTGQDHDPADFMVEESHWFEGLMGYFWAYTTGAVAASTLHDTIARDGLVPDNHPSGLADYLKPYYQIIRDRIFLEASKQRPADLLKKALGTPLDIRSYHDRLRSYAGPDTPAPDEMLANKYRKEQSAPKLKTSLVKAGFEVV